MGTKTADQLVELAFRCRDYLAGLPRFSGGVVPVRVTFTFGKKEVVHYGCLSKLEETYLATERAVTEGGKRAGDTYYRERFDLLGKRCNEMAAKFRDGECKWCFRHPGDDYDWYVSSHWEGDAAFYHPFGPWFSVHRWDHELPCLLGRIDNGLEPKTRATMLVEELAL